MIFNNLKLSDLSLELEHFLRHIVGRALPKNFHIVGRVLPKNFDLSIGGNELEVTFQATTR